MNIRSLSLALTLLATASSCRSMYYGTMEQFGVHKRDILVDRVKEGRAAQDEARKEFKSALEAFKASTHFQGGELERVYEDLKDHYETSADQAAEVKSRIESIETVSGDLFEEWKDEIETLQNPEYRRKSESMLADTQQRYRGLIAAMKAAEKKMQPVLVAFRDHVTFLKHNLNAQAIASLQGQLANIEDDVAALIRDMEKSIAEADAFIENMESKSSAK